MNTQAMIIDKLPHGRRSRRYWAYPQDYENSYYVKINHFIFTLYGTDKICVLLCVMNQCFGWDTADINTGPAIHCI